MPSEERQKSIASSNAGSWFGKGWGKRLCRELRRANWIHFKFLDGAGCFRESLEPGGLALSPALTPKCRPQASPGLRQALGLWGVFQRFWGQVRNSQRKADTKGLGHLQSPVNCVELPSLVPQLRLPARVGSVAVGPLQEAQGCTPPHSAAGRCFRHLHTRGVRLRLEQSLGLRPLPGTEAQMVSTLL